MSTKNLIESAQAMDANTAKQGSARMKIIGADQRLAEARGVKALIVGPTGVGKTSLLRTLDPARVLFVDSEAGDLAVQDLPLDTVRIDDWPTARNLACRMAAQIHLFRRPLVTHSHTSNPSADRSKILVDTTSFSSIASPQSAGCHFAGLNNSRKRARNAPARKIFAARTNCAPERC